MEGKVNKQFELSVSARFFERIIMDKNNFTTYQNRYDGITIKDLVKTISLKVGIFYSNPNNKNYYVPIYAWRKIGNEDIQGKFMGSIVIEKQDKQDKNMIFEGNDGEVFLELITILEEGQYDLVLFSKEIEDSKIIKNPEEIEKLDKNANEGKDLGELKCLSFTHFSVTKEK